jgi:hypothetical protein
VGRGTQVLIAEFRAMLKKCAPGHEWIETDHYIRIVHREKALQNFPKGAHGKRSSRDRARLGLEGDRPSGA